MQDKLADEVAVAFGQVLRRARMRVGLSQEELAHRCERHRTLISMLERGIRQPSLTTVFRLARELNVKPSRLIARMDSLG